MTTKVRSERTLGPALSTRSGGVTGDFLGATQQLTELVVLGVLVVTST